MKILICGVGAIGSNLANILTADLRGQHEITILDKDTVEERNTRAGTQYYLPEQIGTSKVESLQFNLFKRHQREVEIIYQEFSKEFYGIDPSRKYDLVIDCFDNYNSRLSLQLKMEDGSPLLHVGFSNDFTFAVEWDDSYKIPDNAVTIDICEMEGAAAFVGRVASTAALVVEEFLRDGKKLDVVGGRFNETVLR